MKFASIALLFAVTLAVPSSVVVDAQAPPAPTPTPTAPPPPVIIKEGECGFQGSVGTCSEPNSTCIATTSDDGVTTTAACYIPTKMDKKWCYQRAGTNPIVINGSWQAFLAASKACGTAETYNNRLSKADSEHMKQAIDGCVKKCATPKGICQIACEQWQWQSAQKCERTSTGSCPYGQSCKEQFWPSGVTYNCEWDGHMGEPVMPKKPFKPSSTCGGARYGTCVNPGEVCHQCDGRVCKAIYGYRCVVEATIPPRKCGSGVSRNYSGVCPPDRTCQPRHYNNGHGISGIYYHCVNKTDGNGSGVAAGGDVQQPR